MAIKEVLKVTRKTYINPRAWLGYDSLKDQTRIIYGFLKSAFIAPREAERTETFAEAMQRMGLDDEGVREIRRTYFIYAMIFLGLAVIDFGYGFYLLLHHHAFLGLVMSLAVCTVLLSQAFKYHFWYFQIKYRKLGCSFEEWKQGKPNKGI